ncbi:hypothetical protein WDU94_010783 [Cyamophila willieti]
MDEIAPCEEYGKAAHNGAQAQNGHLEEDTVERKLDSLNRSVVLDPSSGSVALIEKEKKKKQYQEFTSRASGVSAQAAEEAAFDKLFSTMLRAALAKKSNNEFFAFLILQGKLGEFVVLRDSNAQHIDKKYAIPGRTLEKIRAFLPALNGQLNNVILICGTVTLKHFDSCHTRGNSPSTRGSIPQHIRMPPSINHPVLPNSPTTSTILTAVASRNIPALEQEYDTQEADDRAAFEALRQGRGRPSHPPTPPTENTPAVVRFNATIGVGPGLEDPRNPSDTSREAIELSNVLDTTPDGGLGAHNLPMGVVLPDPTTLPALTVDKIITGSAQSDKVNIAECLN